MSQETLKENPAVRSVSNAEMRMHDLGNDNLRGLLWRRFIVSLSPESRNPRSLKPAGHRQTFRATWDRNADLEAKGGVQAKNEVETRWGRSSLAMAVSPCEGRIGLKLSDPTKCDAMQLELNQLLDNLPPILRAQLGGLQLHKTGDNQGLELSVDLLGVGLDKEMFTDGLAQLVGEYVSPPGVKPQARHYSPVENITKSTTSLLQDRDGLWPFMRRFQVMANEPQFTLAEEALIQTAKGRKSLVAVVYGTTGSGKTTLSRELILALQELGLQGRTGGYQTESHLNNVSTGIVGSAFHDELKPEIVVVTASSSRPSVLETVQAYQKLLAKNGGKQIVLFLDNVHTGVEWPAPSSEDNKQLLETLDDLHGELARRGDGSAVLLVGERLPANLDASQTQGHRFEIFEDSLAPEDILAKKTGNPLALRLMEGLAEDREPLQALLLDIQRQRPGIDPDVIENGYKKLCKQVIRITLSSKRLETFVRTSNQEKYLSRSHLTDVGSLVINAAIRAEIVKAIIQDNKNAAIQLKDGKTLIFRDQRAAQVIANVAANKLIEKASDTATGKTRELATNTPLSESAMRTGTLVPPKETVDLETIRQTLASRVERRRSLEIEINEREQQINRLKSEERVIETAKALMESDQGKAWQVLGRQITITRSLLSLLTGAEEVNVPEFAEINWNSLLDSLASFETLESGKKRKMSWDGLKAVFSMVNSRASLEQVLPAIKALGIDTKREWIRAVLAGLDQIESADQLIRQKSVAEAAKKQEQQTT